MKTYLLTACFIASLSVTGVAANEPSSEDTEAAEAIGRAEFARNQNEIFNKADKNFDGRVTHDEVLRLTHEQNRPKYVAAFKALDTNKNGLLSLNEIETRHEAFTAQRLERLSKNKENLLKRYDQDGNGTITSRELDSYFARMSQSRQDNTAKNAAKDMKGKDTDESGSVSLDEYLESKTMAAIQIARRAHLSTPSVTRDPNGDKIITRSENEAFALKLFEALDKNKDDEISAAEQSNPAFKRAAKLSTRTLILTDRKTTAVQLN